MPLALKSADSRECQIVAAIRAGLDRANLSGFRAVECKNCHGTVTIRGAVSSFYLKQLAQEIARRTAGVVAVHNRLEVHS